MGHRRRQRIEAYRLNFEVGAPVTWRLLLDTLLAIVRRRHLRVLIAVDANVRLGARGGVTTTTGIDTRIADRVIDFAPRPTAVSE